MKLGNVMNTKPLMVGLGEVLWDLFPSGRKLGGAPANFAYMAGVFGNRAVVASRVGTDELGHCAFQALNQQGLDASHIQQDDRHETGTAGVLIGEDGQPKFEIAEPAAWDFMEWTRQWEDLSKTADAVCFGTLAQRARQSRATIQEFLQSLKPGTLKICDANFREPFISEDVVRQSFRFADILKLNEEELLLVSSLLNLKGGSVIRLAKELLSTFDFRLVCVTRGSGGSILLSRDGFVEHSGMAVKVADAVGAGDAFTACVAHFYLEGRSLTEISEYANRIAAWVATQVGAMPSITRSQLIEILSPSTQERA